MSVNHSYLDYRHSTDEIKLQIFNQIVINTHTLTITLEIYLSLNFQEIIQGLDFIL